MKRVVTEGFTPTLCYKKRRSRTSSSDDDNGKKYGGADRRSAYAAGSR